MCKNNHVGPLFVISIFLLLSILISVIHHRYRINCRSQNNLTAYLKKQKQKILSNPGIKP